MLIQFSFIVLADPFTFFILWVVFWHRLPLTGTLVNFWDRFNTVNLFLANFLTFPFRLRLNGVLPLLLWLFLDHPFLFAVGAIPIGPGFVEQCEAGRLVAAAAVD